MITLLFFAFIAGIVTTLSPCILPVLPLLLAAGVGQSNYRAYAIIFGLVISFTFFTLALTALVHATGISPTTLRYISIGLIIFFGLTMIFPSLERALTAPLVRLGSQAQQASAARTGIFSGIILGTALGLVWTPCAGPILATISTLAATGAVTIYAVIVTLAYSMGTALPMFFIMYGGSKINQSISHFGRYTEYIRKLFGLLMILGALAILFHADIFLQQLAIKYFPSLKIEENTLVQKELATLHKGSAMNSRAPSVGSLAPEFVGIAAWLNSAPLTIEQLRGKVVLVDFWTYSCINCVRTLPYLKKWYQTYKNDGFVIVGVHTPEFAFEHDLSNVQEMVNHFGITYPVALDNSFSTWQNYHNSYWPAHYLLNKDGIIRYIHFGEGEYDQTENMIRSLLGMAPLAMQHEKQKITAQTPEIYLGSSRAHNYSSQLTIKPNMVTTYNYPGPLAKDEIGLKGSWLVAEESITSQEDNAQLTLNYMAQHVYLVMSAPQSSLVHVLLDNQPVAPENRSSDMNSAGEITVKASRMYTLIDSKQTGRHTLTLQIPRNVSLYAFTFGTD
jgi:cytochrome c biogenesis protein CcdA/thiol-disulfide isomerase/thioredoxin